MFNNSDHLHNERGVIAEQYSLLQAVHILDQSKAHHPLPKGSVESTTRAILQSIEIGLLNIHNLLLRATDDIRGEAFGKAMIKMSWAHGFQQVMVRVSTMLDKMSMVPPMDGPGCRLSIIDSPAFNAYGQALKEFDQAMLACIDVGTLPVGTLLAQQSLDHQQLRLIHLIRLCNHETMTWENNLSEIYVPCAIASYETFVLSQDMHDAVYNTTLEGDTYYTQFRGLHQIPEILSAEMNDHIELAILQIRSQVLPQAWEHLRWANVLSEGVIASLQPIADNLTTSDYHAIRENLGLTSGSHSVSIHYHLFSDLYEQLWQELSKFVENNYTEGNQKLEIQHILRLIDQRRFNDQQAFLLHSIANELLTLRIFTREWRNSHLNLPRNNIGGGRTKSLTGSPDAILAVEKMRNAAIRKDPMYPLAAARNLGTAQKNTQLLPLSGYFETSIALDKKILEATGNTTKERFQRVQERIGIFAQKGPFVPPTRRQV